MVTENSISEWSEPLTRNVSVGLSHPEVVTDRQFNVTRFSYRYS